MAEVELTKAYISCIPSFQGAEKSIADGLVGAVGGASDKAGKASGTSIAQSILGEVGNMLPGNMGGILSKAGAMGGGEMLASLKGALGPAAVAAAAVGVTKGLYDLGTTWDSAFDTMRAGTGATGEALESLQQSLRNVVGQTPAEIGEVSQVMADLNTRTGATGETLEDLTKQFVNLGQLGYSTDINKATGMMTAWGVSTEDMASKLDELFVVSQSTGISMDSMTSAMSANAAAMQQLGFSFEDTAAMAGMLDKAGLDASGMMSKMSRACVNLAKDGEEPAEAYRRIVSEMQGFIDAGDEASAMNLAQELFGTRGAAQFLQAVQTGALNIEDMTAAMENANGAIESNEKANESAAEKFEILKNNVSALLEPLGSAVFGAAADIMQGILDVVSGLTGGFQQLTQDVMGNAEVQEALAGVMSSVDSAGQVLAPMFDAIGGAVSSVTAALGLNESGFGGVASIVSGVFVGALNGAKVVIDGVAGAAQAAGAVIDWFKGLFSGSLRFPSIVMPHITLSPSGWGPGDLLKGVVPSIGINWYAKGGAFPANTPMLVGMGDAAEPEYALTQSHLDAIAARMSARAGGSTITVNIDGARINDEVGIRDATKTYLLDLHRIGAI